MPTLSEDVANTLGLSNVRSVGNSVGSAESVGRSVGTLRREWRIVANTGELRGVCWRERDAKRKVVRYVGKRNKQDEFQQYAVSYEGWRRTNRTFVGTGIVATDDTVGKGRGKGSVGNG